MIFQIDSNFWIILNIIEMTLLLTSIITNFILLNKFRLEARGRTAAIGSLLNYVREKVDGSAYNNNNP